MDSAWINLNQQSVPWCLCPGWFLKWDCITGWCNSADNWIFEASFCSVVLHLVREWLRRNLIETVLSAPNHISCLLVCWIYHVREETWPLHQISLSYFRTSCSLFQINILGYYLNIIMSRHLFLTHFLCHLILNICMSQLLCCSATVLKLRG